MTPHFWNPIMTEKRESRMKLNLNISFEFDYKFWAIIPAFNLNLHSKTFEIEWLCFAVYFDFKQTD
jgi:hypothetical protein